MAHNQLRDLVAFAEDATGQAKLYTVQRCAVVAYDIEARQVFPPAPPPPPPPDILQLLCSSSAQP